MVCAGGVAERHVRYQQLRQHACRKIWQPSLCLSARVPLRRAHRTCGHVARSLSCTLAAKHAHVRREKQSVPGKLGVKPKTMHDLEALLMTNVVA